MVEVPVARMLLLGKVSVLLVLISLCLPEYQACSVVVLEPCTTLPCVNGGICVKTNSTPGYLCHCPWNYHGSHCEKEGRCLRQNLALAYMYYEKCQLLFNAYCYMHNETALQIVRNNGKINPLDYLFQDEDGCYFCQCKGCQLKPEPLVQAIGEDEACHNRKVCTLDSCQAAVPDALCCLAAGGCGMAMCLDRFYPLCQYEDVFRPMNAECEGHKDEMLEVCGGKGNLLVDASNGCPTCNCKGCPNAETLYDWECENLSSCSEDIRCAADETCCFFKVCHKFACVNPHTQGN